MNEHDLVVAREMGELKADVRTIKHDVANLSGKLDGLSALITKANMQQARGLGFFAGAAFIISGAATLVIAFAKLIFGGQG